MNAHILVAEDDRVVRKMVSSYLQSAGYRVFEAATVPEALHAIRTDAFDLIVLDLTLLDADPFGGLTDGFAFLLVLKRNWPDLTLPVVVYTGDDSPALEARAKAAGVLEVVRKGSPPEELLAAIQRALGQRVEEPS
ncbi:MAG: response regulator [Verrucomicrobia bacterium]|nr:response regulator [Verrucomicrobiota bacterium]